MRVRLILTWVFLLCTFSFAESVPENEPAESIWKKVLFWPFSHVVQPVLNAVVFPMSAPIKYAFENGVVEKSVELFTFGEKGNILIYPVMNLRPGTSTMLGMNYRHRSMVLERDYFVVEPFFYANSDIYLGVRYSKQGIAGLPVYGQLRFQQQMDRDGSFIIPGTKQSFVQPDSSTMLRATLSVPLNKSETWGLSLFGQVDFIDASVPDQRKDSVLVDDKYSIEAHGLYQDDLQFPVELSVYFDNLDCAYAPSKGNRFSLSARYVFVRPYEGVTLKTGADTLRAMEIKYGDNGANHDFVRTELVFQHYFFFGRSKDYVLSVQEARKNRKFYTDFSLEEALRVWLPENIANTLLERRVIALQFRMINVWEMEKGEAPHNAYPYLNARFPMRGYSDAWTANHVMGLSAEYRWPIDRFVDGVLFDEYGMHASEFDDWSFGRFYNSWGFGVRVRQPNMFLFRTQLGFHGLHGISLVMTIAPEFR